MMKILTAAFAFAIAIPLCAGHAQAEQSTAGVAPVRHLVYQFGYNTPAANSGYGTGTTTIDLAGIASDGGVKITATDDWWNTVKPRQSYTCELYPTGALSCPEPPNAVSPIQVAIVPLLAQDVFAPLNDAASLTWTQNWNVRATFFPGAQDFAGQVDTWNCAYRFEAVGTAANTISGLPLNKIRLSGSMTQQGGRRIVADQDANILFDPRLKMPVYIDESMAFLPRYTTDRYTVEMKLIRF